MKKHQLIGVALVLCLMACGSQLRNKDMDESSKNFSCEVETGLCSPTEKQGIEEIQLKKEKQVRLVYYTDPICSACWAIEPQLKRFKLEYGDYVHVEYRMGGLLPGWEGFADKGNGISKPSDVAHHWEDVGRHTGMGINGDVWLEDPLHSSFPPSIAFKAAQRQGEGLALRFLRRIREQVFLEKKNITKEEFLLQAMRDCGGDTERFLKDYHDSTTEQAFLEEMQDGRNMGVRGFPTFIFMGKDGKGFKISGMSGYSNYVLALEKALGEKPQSQAIQLTESDLLEKHGFLATKEISFVLSQNDDVTNKRLLALAKAGKVEKVPFKNGDFWRWKGK